MKEFLKKFFDLCKEYQEQIIRLKKDLYKKRSKKQRHTKERVKDSTWRSKYDTVFKNVINAIKSKSKALINGAAPCIVAFN